MKPAFSLTLILVIFFVLFGVSNAHLFEKASAAPNFTFTVGNSGDAPDADLADYLCLTASGHCTLRAAIQQANYMNAAHNEIYFSGFMIISPDTALPALTNNHGITINAGGQIYLMGTDLPAGSGDGLTLASDNNEIMGLVIAGFDNGIVVTGDNNLIGTDGDGDNDASEKNVLYSNRCTNCTGYGIQLAGSNNIVAGNYIGVATNGSDSGPNKTGIFVSGNHNRIGTDGDNTSDTLERNIVSGNIDHGIEIEGDNTVVAGNYIGLKSNGTEAQPNRFVGVTIHELAANTRIGTNSNGSGDSAERNIISGNFGNGVSNQGDYTLVMGNYIGTNATGTGAIPNGVFGVVVADNSENGVIGTNGDGIRDILEGNLISGNTSGGVKVTGANQGTWIAGNKIGTDISGTVALANVGDGIYAEGLGTDLVIGTNGDGLSDSIEDNLISGNSQNGIYLYGGLTGAVIAGNYIGTNINGTVAIANGAHGVMLARGAHHNRIGMAFSYPVNTLERNLISGNTESGVRIKENGSDGNQVVGNYIGTDASGNTALGNQYGVKVEDRAAFTQIGGVSPQLGNLISGNTMDGIAIGTLCDTTTIGSNIIGLNALQTTALGNGSHGIYLSGGAFNSNIYQNTIAENGGAGIFMSETAGSGNAHSSNFIYKNDGLGIDLAPAGVNLNDPGDADSGPNDRMNYPEFAYLSTNGNHTLIEGILDSGIPNQDFLVSFILVENCDPSGYGEGIVEVFQTNVIETDSSGVGNFFYLLDYYSTDYPYLVMATQHSEFSECKLIENTGSIVPAQLSIADASRDEGDSGSTWMDFDVTLDRTASIPVSFYYSISSGSAIAGQDYTYSSGTITVPPGTTQQTISVEILGDTQAEPHETFQVGIYDSIGAEIQDAYATGTILDDDGGSGYSIFLPIVIR